MLTSLKTTDGRAKVLAVNIINKTVRVKTEEEGIKTFKVEELLEIETYDKKTPKPNGE